MVPLFSGSKIKWSFQHGGGGGGMGSRQNRKKDRKYALQDRNPNLAKLSSLDEPRPQERKLTSSFHDW